MAKSHHLFRLTRELLLVAVMKRLFRRLFRELLVAAIEAGAVIVSEGQAAAVRH